MYKVSLKLECVIWRVRVSVSRVDAQKEKSTRLKKSTEIQLPIYK